MANTSHRTTAADAVNTRTRVVAATPAVEYHYPHRNWLELGDVFFLKTHNELHPTAARDFAQAVARLEHAFVTTGQGGVLLPLVFSN